MRLLSIAIFISSPLLLAQEPIVNQSQWETELIQKALQNIEQALQKRGAIPAPGGRELIIPDPQALYSRVRALFPAGVLRPYASGRIPRGGIQFSGQVEVPVEKTDRGRVVELVHFEIAVYPAGADARRRMAEQLTVQAMFLEGSLQPPEVGELAYHYPPQDGTHDAHIVFIRNTVVVKLGWSGPVFIRNPEEDEDYMGPPELVHMDLHVRQKCQQLAVDIDHVLQEMLRFPDR